MANPKKYILPFTILCLVSLVLAYALSMVESPYLKTNHFWIPTVFFALTTFGIHAVLTKGDKNSKEFAFKTLAMSMARLLVCLVAVLIYSRVNQTGGLAFACHFMIQYLLFTVFEIYFLLKYIKQPN